jgi:hypothetical protein
LETNHSKLNFISYLANIKRLMPEAYLHFFKVGSQIPNLELLHPRCPENLPPVALLEARAPRRQAHQSPLQRQDGETWKVE